MKKHPVDVCSLYLIYFRGIRELRFDSVAENKNNNTGRRRKPLHKCGVYAHSNKIAEYISNPRRGCQKYTVEYRPPRQIITPDNIWHLNNKRLFVTLQIGKINKWYMKIADNQGNTVFAHLGKVCKSLIVSILPPPPKTRISFGRSVDYVIQAAFQTFKVALKALLSCLFREGRPVRIFKNEILCFKKWCALSLAHLLFH